jgi:hypothetical protein
LLALPYPHRFVIALQLQLVLAQLVVAQRISVHVVVAQSVDVRAPLVFRSPRLHDVVLVQLLVGWLLVGQLVDVQLVDVQVLVVQLLLAQFVVVVHCLLLLAVAQVFATELPTVHVVFDVHLVAVCSVLDHSC